MIGGAAAPGVLPIDLGLPSGTLWADRNIGASASSAIGLYFSWGNVIGHQYGDGYRFNADNYAETSGAAIGEDLNGATDAAHVYLGGSWVMPSAALITELIDNCVITQTTLGTTSGYIFTSRINGAQLFFPAEGSIIDDNLTYFGQVGYYYTADYISSDSCNVLLLNYSNKSIIVIPRSRGIGVRACIPGTI